MRMVLRSSLRTSSEPRRPDARIDSDQIWCTTDVYIVNVERESVELSCQGRDPPTVAATSRHQRRFCDAINPQKTWRVGSWKGKTVTPPTAHKFWSRVPHYFGSNHRSNDASQNDVEPVTGRDGRGRFNVTGSNFAHRSEEVLGEF
eukprot:IDg4679t1